MAGGWRWGLVTFLSPRLSRQGRAGLSVVRAYLSPPGPNPPGSLRGSCVGLQAAWCPAETGKWRPGRELFFFNYFFFFKRKGRDSGILELLVGGGEGYGGHAGLLSMKAWLASLKKGLAVGKWCEEALLGTGQQCSDLLEAQKNAFPWLRS